MSLNIILGFIAISFISVLSLVGIFFISLKQGTLDKILFILIAFATGTILASAILDLIPESIHNVGELIDSGTNISESIPFTMSILGFIAFFILERFIYWFHGHVHENPEKHEMTCQENIGGFINENSGEKSKIKSFALLNLVGDGLHNFMDGMIIMIAFALDVKSGVVVMLAVFFHELPQEIGDYGILIFGGFSSKKALIFNFISALFSLLGGFLALFFSGTIESFKASFLAFAGGGFIYISAAELMPEIIKEKNLKKSVIQAAIFIVGIITIYLFIILMPHE
ncbi:MAG: ZIP family metal transporter [Promethearchaeota archaeon]